MFHQSPLQALSVTTATIAVHYIIDDPADIINYSSYSNR